jgi:hypothetical protein
MALRDLEALAAMVNADSTSTISRLGTTRPRSAFAAAMEQRRRTAQEIRPISQHVSLEPSIASSLVDSHSDALLESTDSTSKESDMLSSSITYSPLQSRRRQPALPLPSASSGAVIPYHSMIKDSSHPNYSMSHYLWIQMLPKPSLLCLY